MRKYCFVEGFDLIEGVCEAENEYWQREAKIAVNKKKQEKKTAIGQAYMDGFMKGVNFG